MKTNCRNCGAPVPFTKVCGYCGTNYAPPTQTFDDIIRHTNNLSFAAYTGTYSHGRVGMMQGTILIEDEKSFDKLRW